MNENGTEKYLELANRQLVRGITYDHEGNFRKAVKHYNIGILALRIILKNQRDSTLIERLDLFSVRHDQLMKSKQVFGYLIPSEKIHRCVECEKSCDEDSINWSCYYCKNPVCCEDQHYIKNTHYPRKGFVELSIICKRHSQLDSLMNSLCDTAIPYQIIQAISYENAGKYHKAILYYERGIDFLELQVGDKLKEQKDVDEMISFCTKRLLKFNKIIFLK